MNVNKSRYKDGKVILNIEYTLNDRGAFLGEEKLQNWNGL